MSEKYLKKIERAIEDATALWGSDATQMQLEAILSDEGWEETVKRLKNRLTACLNSKKAIGRVNAGKELGERCSKAKDLNLVG